MAVYRGFIDTRRKEKQQEGRTGRQGSPGIIYTILNKQDFPGMTVNEKQIALEKAAKKTRHFNKELYAIIGYLYFQAKNQPPEFFREKWARFSTQVELNYSKLQQEKSYHRERFVKKVVCDFNQLLQEEKISAQEEKTTPLDASEVIHYLEHVYPKKEKPEPDQTPVKIADCVSPEVIAYHFLNEDEKKIRRAFFSDFLKEQVGISSKNSLRGWVGLQGHLHKILSDESYLFSLPTHSNFAEKKEEKEEKDDDTHVGVTKSVIIGLLDEYLQNSWFISDFKKEKTKELKDYILRLENTTDIYKVIQDAKIFIADKDIETNKKRKIKSVNMTGSRLQSTLDRALLSITVLENQPIVNTYDLYDILDRKIKKSDPYNQAVLRRSKRFIQKLNAPFESPPEMVGRFKFFERSDPTQSKEEESQGVSSFSTNEPARQYDWHISQL
jgi:superfamily II DNA/RNA helicase